jgi:hypothetical protein
VEEFWIILGSLAGVVTAVVTIWLVILARRPASSPASSAAEPTAKEEPDVEVTVANLFETFEQPRDLGPWSFSIRGINRSDHPVRFTSAGFERSDGKQIVITEQPPHDSGQTWMDCESLSAAGLDIYGPIVGWVRTATDDLFKSEPKVLRSRD